MSEPTADEVCEDCPHMLYADHDALGCRECSCVLCVVRMVPISEDDDE